MTPDPELATLHTPADVKAWADNPDRPPLYGEIAKCVRLHNGLRLSEILLKSVTAHDDNVEARHRRDGQRALLDTLLEDMDRVCDWSSDDG